MENQAIQFSLKEQFSEIETITPDIAVRYLSKNINNRKLRPKHVEALASEMRRGTFVLSHQGIAFNTRGHLIDGQNRLNAVIAANVPVKMLVTRNVQESAAQVMDIGAKRNIADSLRINKKHAETLAFIVRVLTGKSHATPSQVQTVDGALGRFSEILMEHCGTNRRVLTSAPIKAAATLTMYIDPSEKNMKFVLDTYRNIVLINVESLHKSGAAFVRQMLGNAKKQNYDTFARAMIVFDEKKANVGKIQVPDTATYVNYVRDKMPELVDELTK
jgi:hypothetical protein